MAGLAVYVMAKTVYLAVKQTLRREVKKRNEREGGANS
jgi:hypothetical protein